MVYEPAGRQILPFCCPAAVIQARQAAAGPQRMNGIPFSRVCGAAGAGLDAPEAWVALCAGCHLDAVWVSTLEAASAMKLSCPRVHTYKAKPRPCLDERSALGHDSCCLVCLKVMRWHKYHERLAVLCFQAVVVCTAEPLLLWGSWTCPSCTEQSCPR